MPSKIYSYQSSLVQSIVVGQSAGTEILFKPVTPKYYTYPSTSQMVHLLKEEVEWMATMDSTNKLPYKTKLYNKHYIYQSTFQTVHLLKEEVGWIATMDSINKPPTKPKTIRGKWSTYPSFFMNIKTIPTYKWSCDTQSDSDDWSCN